MRKFHAAVTQLAKLSGKDFEKVIKHELAAILSGAIRNTKKATPKTIRESARKQPGMVLFSQYKGPESRTGKQYTPQQAARLARKAAERRSRGDGLIYYLPQSRQPKRYPNWIWQQIQDKRARKLQERLGARGLAARMWVHIADQLRMSVNAPAYVRNAKNAKSGDMRQMVQVAQSGTGKQYQVGFVNALTKTNPPARAGIAFRAALNARANYFRKSVELTAKGAIKSVFDRYPNLGRFS